MRKLIRMFRIVPTDGGGGGLSEQGYLPELVANEEEVIYAHTSNERVPTNGEFSINVINALSDKGYTHYPAFITEFYHDFTPSFLNPGGEGGEPGDSTK